LKYRVIQQPCLAEPDDQGKQGGGIYYLQLFQCLGIGDTDIFYLSQGLLLDMVGYCLAQALGVPFTL
jgi:hypothetical protein